MVMDESLAQVESQLRRDKIQDILFDLLHVD